MVRVIAAVPSCLSIADPSTRSNAASWAVISRCELGGFGGALRCAVAAPGGRRLPGLVGFDPVVSKGVTMARGLTAGGPGGF